MAKEPLRHLAAAGVARAEDEYAAHGMAFYGLTTAFGIGAGV